MNRGEAYLDVPVVALAFRSGLDADETYQTAQSISPCARCWAIMPEAEAGQVLASWDDSPDVALLVHYLGSEDPFDVACELLGSLPPGPVAVLLANLPASRGLLPVSRRRAEREAIRKLEAVRGDVQVHLHRGEWLNRPPRIR